MKRNLLYIVLPNDGEHSVQWILKNRLNLSAKAIKRAKFMEDGLMINGKRVFTNYIVKAGDSLLFNLESDEDCSENILPVKGDIDIVYEDDDLLVINKGRNTPVHPSLGHFDDTLANYLAYYFQSRGLNFVFRAVNRLDGNTSGLMLVGKTSHAHKMLMEQLSDRRLCRTYNAIVHGCPTPTFGTIDAPIKRKAEMELVRIISPDGQRAVTHYKTLVPSLSYSLVELRLDTGRTHQIRVHMAHIGHPVVGDFLYGHEDISLISGHALHSKTLEFFHPMTGEKMIFTSNLPTDMENILSYIDTI